MTLHLILIGWLVFSIGFALVFSPWLAKHVRPR